MRRRGPLTDPEKVEENKEQDNDKGVYKIFIFHFLVPFKTFLVFF